MMWIFEDKLKQLVSEFINVISNLSRDPLLESKKKGILYNLVPVLIFFQNLSSLIYFDLYFSAVYISWALLKKKPEGEKQFLDVIVNKLGDPK